MAIDQRSMMRNILIANGLGGLLREYGVDLAELATPEELEKATDIAESLTDYADENAEIAEAKALAREYIIRIISEE